jgi:hypothetical protein
LEIKKLGDNQLNNILGALAFVFRYEDICLTPYKGFEKGMTS